MLGITTENLCYLLWKQEVRRENWPKQLYSWAKCSSLPRAEELLRGAPIESDEQHNVCRILHIPEEDLQYVRLIAKDPSVNILQENLKYLTDNLIWGQKKKLAEAVGIHQNHISKWLRGRHEPTDPHLEGIAEFFKIPQQTDLKKTPIFLQLDPVTDMQRRQWLQRQIEIIGADTLREMFPSLRKLLES